VFCRMNCFSALAVPGTSITAAPRTDESFKGLFAASELRQEIVQ
jgi:hypothetical protein